MTLRSISIRLVGLLLTALTAASSVSVADDGTLTVGDAAPALDVEHWVQDNDGKLEPVTNFEEGKVYIVEFWATWCGPCVMSMPHLAEVQTEYGYDDVRLISVSDEDLETVTGFLERKVNENDEGEDDEGEDDQKAQTYEDLTSVYSLTTDPDRSVYEDYMTAAGQTGIPTAFIVGKQGIVEWIGHPMEMDEPLEMVVADSWDREAFAEEFKERQKMGLLLAKIGKLMSSGKDGQQEALDLIDAELADGDMSGSMEANQLKQYRLILMVQMGRGVEAIRERLDEANDLGGVMNTAMLIQRLPEDTNADDMKSLLGLAAEKIGEVRTQPPAAGNEMLQLRIDMTLAGIYQSAGMTGKAREILVALKEKSEDDRLVQMIDQAIEQLDAEAAKSSDDDQ